MNLKEITSRFSELEIYEQRSSSESYNELVFLNSEFDKWLGVLSDIFGPAVKPAGQEPSDAHSQLTKSFGGIFSNQTLFSKEFDGSMAIAMFWPWQDNTHTTLKIALIDK